MRALAPGRLLTLFHPTMKSMTGYGRASTAFGNQTLTVQINSVNRKTLDLTFALPDEWESLEALIGEHVRKFAARGKVHVTVEFSGAGQGRAALSWDDTAVGEVIDRLQALAAKRGVPFAVTPELLWSVANNQRGSVALPGADEIKPVVEKLLHEALVAFAAMRAKEGAALLADFNARLAILTANVATVAARAAEVPKNYGEQLRQRLRQAGLAELNLDDERILKEIALFADRCDIAEELTRLRSHLAQFADHLKGGGEVGRKSEFILQEIGREVHTIGSKANDLAIARCVIEMKNELERIREQVANIE